MQAGHLQRTDDWKSSTPPHCHSSGAGDTEMCCPLVEPRTGRKVCSRLFQKKWHRDRCPPGGRTPETHHQRSASALAGDRHIHEQATGTTERKAVGSWFGL